MLWLLFSICFSMQFLARTVQQECQSIQSEFYNGSLLCSIAAGRNDGQNLNCPHNWLSFRLITHQAFPYSRKHHSTARNQGESHVCALVFAME